MEKWGIRKMAGFSSITISGKVYKFIAGVRSHSESATIEETMREIVKRLEATKYSPMTS